MRAASARADLGHLERAGHGPRACGERGQRHRPDAQPPAAALHGQAAQPGRAAAWGVRRGAGGARAGRAPAAGRVSPRRAAAWRRISAASSGGRSARAPTSRLEPVPSRVARRARSARARSSRSATTARAAVAERPSASTTEAPVSSAMNGSRSWRMRLRRNRGSRLLGSSAQTSLRSRRYSSSALRRVSISGRISNPRTGAIAAEPARSRALQEPHQHGLGLIVGGMAGGDARGTDQARRPARARRGGRDGSPPRARPTGGVPARP